MKNKELAQLREENKELKELNKALLDRHESMMKGLRYMQKVLHGEA